MPMPADLLNKQITTSLSADGTLTIRLVEEQLPQLSADEVLIKVEATPLNPSDITRMFGLADLTTISGLKSGTGLTLKMPAAKMPAMSARIDQTYTVGNEGAGTIVDAGSAPAAQALIGKRVAIRNPGLFANYKIADAKLCTVIPTGMTAAQSAAIFINPLTALAMIGTMQREKRPAMILTTAASNLGQMVNRLCLKDGIDLVCVVRSADQEKILRDQGAQYVCNSSLSTFQEDLIAAICATDATLAYDAISGGEMADQLLFCMEAAAAKKASSFSAYGTNTHKQVYLYGNLDPQPTQLNRTYGMSWGIGGWLVDNYLGSLSPQERAAIDQRVLDELPTTFASHYARTISLEDVCDPQIATSYAKRATGQKLLVTPNGPVDI